MPARGILSHASFERARSEPKAGSPKGNGLFSTATRQAESPSTVESVREQLREAIIPCKSMADPSASFLPLDKQSKIVTPVVIRDMLLNTISPSGCKYTEGEAERIVQGVFQEWPSTALTMDSVVGSPGAGWMATRRRRILTILILIRKVHQINLFIDNDIDDLALPIECNFDAWSKSQYSSGRDWAGDEPPDFGRRLNACFEGFDDVDIDLFNTNQKRVHVPFFQFSTQDEMQIYHFNLDAECVLPIIDLGVRRKGGNAIVQKVIFHSSSYNFEAFQGVGPILCPGGTASEEPVFALKKLDKQGEEPFREEVEIFERLVHSKRPKSPDHLLRLELSFMHGDQGYLLFPWAEVSLKDYWKEARRDPTDQNDITWFFEQCYGLALGLRRLHNPMSYARSQYLGLGHRPANAIGISHSEPDNAEPTAETLRRWAIHGPDVEDTSEEEKYGRHTDVKPENILWYRRYAEEDNHLVLSDFGSAQFSGKDTRSNVSPGVAGQKGTTDTYQAPELAFGSTVTRRYDIWSLGCVFLEFAVWFHQGGWQAVEDFTEERIHDRHEAENPGSKSSFSEDMFYLVKPNGTSRGEFCQGLKPSVKARIEAIRSLATCKAPTKAFLDLIQDHMLVPKATNRESGRMIRETLKAIRNKCRKDAFAQKDIGGYEADFQEEGVSSAAGYFDGTSPETKAREFSLDAEQTLKSEFQDASDDAASSDHFQEVKGKSTTSTEFGRTRRRMSSAEESACTNAKIRPVTPRRIERGSTASTSFISQTSSLLPTARQNTTQLTTPERVGSQQDVCAEDLYDLSLKEVDLILEPEQPFESPKQLDLADDKPATPCAPGAAPTPQMKSVTSSLSRGVSVDDWKTRMKNRASGWMGRFSARSGQRRQPSY